jgi:hypothetical protein
MLLSMFYLSAHKKEVNIAVVINNFESYRLAKKSTQED